MQTAYRVAEIKTYHGQKHISADVPVSDVFMFGDFLLRIGGSGVDRKVREGLRSISSNLHPNPTAGVLPHDILKSPSCSREAMKSKDRE